MPRNQTVLDILVRFREQGLEQTLDRTRRGLGGINSAANQLNNTRATVQAVAGAFTGLYVARTAAQAVGALLQPAIELEDELAFLQGLVSGTSVSMETLKTSALAAAAATRFSPAEAVRALSKLTQSGVDARSAMDLLEPSLRLAQASMGRLGVAGAADVAATLVREFGFSGEELNRRMEQVFLTATRFGVGMDKLPIAMRRLGISTAFGNAKFEEMLISFGLLQGALGGAELATSQMRRLMIELADPKKTAKLRELGLALPALSGNVDVLHDVIGPLLGQLQKMDEAALRSSLFKIFGKSALVPVVTNLHKLSKGVRDTNGELVQGQAAIRMLLAEFRDPKVMGEFAERALGTTEGRLEQLREAWNAVLIAVGTPILDALKPFLSFVRDVALGFRDLMRNFAPFRGLVSVFGKAGVIFFALTVPILAVVAGFSLLRVAMNFVAVQAGPAMIASLNLTQASMAGAMFMTNGLTLALYRARSAMAGFARGAILGFVRWLPYVGLAIAGFSLLADLWGFIRDKFGAGATGVAKEGHKLQGVATALGTAGQSLEDSAEGAADALSEGVAESAKILQALKDKFTIKIPKIKEDVFVRAQARIAGAKDVPEAERRLAIGRIRAMREGLRGGVERGDITDVGIAQMLTHTRQLALTLRRFGLPGVKEMAKTAELFEASQSEGVKTAFALQHAELGLAKSLEAGEDVTLAVPGKDTFFSLAAGISAPLTELRKVEAESLEANRVFQEDFRAWLGDQPAQIAQAMRGVKVEPTVNVFIGRRQLTPEFQAEIREFIKTGSLQGER